MSVPLLDLQAQYRTIAAEVDAAVAELIRSQRFILGPAVERFEGEVAAYLGASHAIGCASGTDAILLALRALELEPGAEVVVPAFTFFATAGAVWNAGLRPVFADIDPATYNMGAAEVEAVLTERTRAVVVVHLFGQMPEMVPLLALAERRGLAVIEDAAQAIGARQRIDGVDRAAGTLGTAGCFSFFPSKNLGGFGDGGLVTTEDAALAERVAKLRVHGGRQMYHHEMVGTNSRLDALQAAVLSAKLPHLDGWAAARVRNADAYDARFRERVPALTTPARLPGNVHVFNQYTVRTARRDALKAALDGAGIGNSIYYPLPLHLQPCFAGLGYGPGDLPVSERAAAEVISLPVYPELTAEQRDQVAGAVEEFFRSSASTPANES
jgi:dTDP-4-amino-4,6-dideoxygalactose transaminase